MEERNKWIAVLFLIFILVVPAVTMARDIAAAPANEGLSDEQREVLENNGALQEPESEETDENAAVVQAESEPVFMELQKSLNSFTERLFGRTRLIAFNTSITSLLTGGTYIESTQVLVGKNNMLFYKTEQDGHPLWDYMGINHFTDEELEEIAANLAATRDYLASRGIEFYAMCIPNKEIIYPENMPDTIVRINEVSRGEQLADYIKEHTDLVFAYPKEALTKAKDEAQLYYNTDTHSNYQGSFVMMQELFKEAYGTFAPLDSVDFRIDSTTYAGDLAYLAGLSTDERYMIDTVYFFKKESADPSQYHDQVLLFIGDSFGGFLSNVCRGYYSADKVEWVFTNTFTTDMYDKYKPDVVIWESAERYCEIFGNSDLIELHDE